MTQPSRLDPKDLERFRLRTFVEQLERDGELEVHDEPVDLADLARHLNGNSKAVLFRKPGPEGAEVVGNVMGSRRRLAAALGVGERELLRAVLEHLRHPIPPVEVSSSESPVHQVILTGDDADLTRLPVHLQHARDGAPYISAALDFALHPAHGWTNVGCRRLMLRGRRETGVDLNAPSDLRAIYELSLAKGKPLPVAFVIGSHPVDYIGATSLVPPCNELALLGAMRGEPVPVVRCVTIDVTVPADAELVLEGYIDERGFVEPEGPYGEYVGYYGVVKRNPVFHLTAITSRRDALFQTATIGGRHLARTDTAHLVALRTEAAVWAALETAIREPVAVYATPSAGGMYNVRISMRPRYPGEARNAIAAAFGSLADVKHVFVVNEDIDVFSDEQMDWALSTRFQADRDLVVASGFRAVPLDPSLAGSRTGAKAGFDLTLPLGTDRELEFAVPEPPALSGGGTQTVEQALEAGPRTFGELMEATGSLDGREVIAQLEELRNRGRLERVASGQYALRAG
jgi:UbiD family decarboxylase